MLADTLVSSSDLHQRLYIHVPPVRPVKTDRLSRDMYGHFQAQSLITSTWNDAKLGGALTFRYQIPNVCENNTVLNAKPYQHYKTAYNL